MKEIFEKTKDYIKENVKDYKEDNRGSIKRFTCPICKFGEHPTCNFIPFSFVVYCHSKSCSKPIGTLVDIVKHLESDKKDFSESQVLEYLAKKYNIEYSSPSEIDRVLQYYKNNKFDLTPIQTNGKRPIEKGWTLKEHKDDTEWKDWLNEGINVGVKTGKISGILILDLDKKEIPEDLKPFFSNYKGFLQESSKGFHFFYKYDDNIPKTRIEKYCLDIETDGGQVVIFPSRVEDIPRKILQCEEIPVLPPDLKKLLLDNTGYKKTELPPVSEEELSKLNEKDLSTITQVEEGNRTNFIMKFGGILRKELNTDQTGFVLRLVNQHFVSPCLPYREIDNCIKSLDKYIHFDMKETASRIYQYINLVEETTARDIKEALGYKKEDIDKVLSHLLKEGYIYKKGRLFRGIKKIEWKDTFMDDGKEVNFKMPYFHDHAVFRDGDLIIIGAKQKVGKTHIALNIVKRLIDQGLKPYYLNTESGNRFAKISETMGLVEGTYWNTTFPSPEQVELENNAITIIDWLLPKDYAETDKLIQHFSLQLIKHRGILIIFVQLKDDGDFFAKNMIPMFPAFVSRYFYDNDDNGETGFFKVDYMREPRNRAKHAKIPCRYDWNSKELKRIDELPDAC